MEELTDYLADYFPDRFKADTWHELLPDFINAQIALYNQRVAGHELEMVEREKGNQSTDAPTYPVMPLAFAQACEEQAKREGLSPQALACSLYIGRERVDYYRDRMNHYKRHCEEYDEVGMELVEQNLGLKATIKAGTSIDKRNN